MSKYFVTAFLLVAFGSVLSNAYTTANLKEEPEAIQPIPEAVEAVGDTEEPQDIRIDGKDAADGTNQGLIATYWNNFLKRARLPLPTFNITNPLSNIFTPYVVEVDSPPEQQQQQPHQQQVQPQPALILLDPATQQYYRVQPISS
ncbi:uncharacterized protein LOC129915067 [Episyrphus balteatus]|uniref:uncharacterized protein LOC129915067 n=1 Tax=Episyrphus balteatus TaxID=286459 RepID=UPI0024865064|nr:uncharacterized protein LOC129915067 [Episyrphus balteatus]